MYLNRSRHIGRSRAFFWAKTIIAATSLAACLLPGMVSAQSSPPLLGSDTATASAGFYRLSWQVPDNTQVEIEEAPDSAFTTPALIYRGYDRASVISGRPDGVWWYRIRALSDEHEPGAWSEPMAVTVLHHPLSRALMFFIVGVIVFVATLTVVVRKGGGPQ